MGKGLTTKGQGKASASNGNTVSTAVDPTIEIGTAAGEVYRYLHANGEVSMTRLRKDLALNGNRVDQALRWLAREEKTLLTKDRRTTLVSLRID